MNILLWVLQFLLAFWNLTGGIYTVFNYEKLKGAWMSALPGPLWVVLGLLQALFALGLVMPGKAIGLPKLTPVAAAYLAINSLLGCVLFANYAGFPGILWGVVPAVLSAFLVYRRMGKGFKSIG